MHYVLICTRKEAKSPQVGGLYPSRVNTFDFLGELDALGVCEGSTLVLYVPDVQHFTHKLYDRLRFVERCGRHCKHTHINSMTD